MEPKLPSPESYPQNPSSSPERYPGPESSPEALPPSQEAIPEGRKEQSPAQPAQQPAIDPSQIALPTPVAPQQGQTDDAKATDDTPQTAADDDLIEKEWVDKAKKIITETRNDPHKQEQEVSKLQADYLRKRYGKELGAS